MILMMNKFLNKIPLLLLFWGMCITELQACAASGQVSNKIIENDLFIEPSLNEFSGNCDSLGLDTNKTLDDVSLYMEFYSHKNYVEALPYWRYVYRNAPGFHDAVYSNGIVIYKSIIDTMQNETMKALYIDTMFSIYDHRIVCFGKRGYNLGRKAYDMMKYTPGNVDMIRETLDTAVAEGGLETEYFLLEPFIKLNYRQLAKGEITVSELLDKYAVVAEIVENNSKGKYATYYQNEMDRVVSYLTDMNVLNCTTLVPFYTNAYAKDPANQAIWKKAFSALGNCNSCTDTIIEMFSKLYELEPSGNLALKLADCYINNGNADKGIQYMEDAILKIDDPEQKADLSYKIASIFTKLKKYSKARQYCYKALKYKPNWGDPYILIGNLYASSGKLCGSGTGWESQIIIWPAIDKWYKAKSVDPSVAAEANKQIAKYSKYMPKFEEIFGRGYSLGDPFTVKCWIQESTTIRASDK